MILLELTGAVDAAGATQTIRLSTDAFTTRPTDTPPDREFMTRLVDPGAIGMFIYSGGGGAIAGGGARLDIGEIIATNNDGEFDHLKNWSFDGRELVMRAPATPGVVGEYPADFPPVLVATMAGVEVGWGELKINVRDPTYIFEKPVLTERFKGDNVLGGPGVEGTADDIKDQLKPQLFGSVPNFAPPCVNAGMGAYQVSRTAVDDISAVYVRGVPQTRGVDHPNRAALMAATVPFGAYQTCLAEGLFRIGANAADGQVTCDASEGAAEGRSCGRLLRRLALMAGVAADQISNQDVADLDALNAAPLGKWLNDETTFGDFMDQAARSVGAWYGFDPTNVLRMGRMDAPKGQPVATLHQWQIVEEGMRRVPRQELPAPLWSVTINHTPIGQTQDTDLAGSVSPERRAFLRNEYRSANAANENIKTQWRLAGAMTLDTLIMDATAAAAEAQRLLDLHSGAEDVFEVPVPMDEAVAVIRRGVWFGRELAIDVNRFGLPGGKAFVVIGVSIQQRAQQVVFRLWAQARPPANQYADIDGFALISTRAEAVGQAASGPVDVTGAASMAMGAQGVGQAGQQPGGGDDESGQPVGVAPLTITKSS